MSGVQQPEPTPEDTGRAGSTPARAASANLGNLHPHERPASGDLALELTGALPCVRCRYNLRGLSVAGVCPECGTAIRATILARVDPQAKELQPLHTPRLTAVLLLVWTCMALLAALASWVPRIVEGLQRAGHALPRAGWPAVLAQAAVGVSALGALALVRPHRRIPAWQSASAAAAIVLHVPLVLVMRHIDRAFDSQAGSAYFEIGGIDPARAAWRLGLDALLLLIIAGLRPNARVLAARSFVMRTGQVDRQTMLAMAAAIGVATLGDLLAVLTPGGAGTAADIVRVAALLFVGVGSLLVTLGLGGMVLDAIRLIPVVAAPPLALSDVAGPAARANGRVAANNPA